MASGFGITNSDIEPTKSTTGAKDFTVGRGEALRMYLPKGSEQVVYTAAELLQRDFSSVLGSALSLDEKMSDKVQIIAGLASDKEIVKLARAHHISLSSLRKEHEGYELRVLPDGRLLIVGSDKRGLAYGMVTLSRALGVSPWEWWGDVTPLPKESFSLPEGYEKRESPDVRYRGIFINDEDWGMMPWASLTYEPAMRALAGENPTPVSGEIGPYTHARIFELMLRLRANLFWPAMHDCTKPFYLTPGNREMAERYGIIVSTSHCEPMMSNANGEWRKWANDPKGNRYNYVSNRDSVLLFWQKRVEEVRHSDCLYTLGMRGIHDGAMQGAKTIPEQVAALTSILKDQRDLLRKTLGKKAEEVPQQFVPYKEVLECYHAGLEVPEDVTLIWCDDNYGYVRHLPTARERARKGGNGIYYHISYWGRPHDYLWLATTHPELIRSEMLRAYDHGIDRLWVLNVGDIKPGEYLTSLYLDMAWDVDRFRPQDALDRYCDAWYAEALGVPAAWHQVWRDYYNLSFDFKPEWMGGTRTEEKDPLWKQPHDLPLNEMQVRQRLVKVKQMAWDADRMLQMQPLPEQRRAAAFQLLEYPIYAMAAQNEKWLTAQLARHGAGGWWPSREAHQRIQLLTEEYNSLLGGKWNRMMHSQPRGLADFSLPEESALTDTLEGGEIVFRPMPSGREVASLTKSSSGEIALRSKSADQSGLLVYRSESYIGDPLPKGEKLKFDIISQAKEILLEIHTLPVHPLSTHALPKHSDSGRTLSEYSLTEDSHSGQPHEGNRIRYSVRIDDGEPRIVEFQTEGRSEEWKQNVLYNRAVRTLRLPLDPALSTHRVVIRALDEGVKIQKCFLHSLGDSDL